jgi:hypothetical protein
MHGESQVRNLQVRYASEVDPVFLFRLKRKKTLTLFVLQGVVLALSFFRFVKASQGSIVIGGININYIGIQELWPS